jgi:acyl carrier protein
MAAQLGEAGSARMQRTGIAPLSEQRGLELFDAALASPGHLAAAVRFDRAVLKGQASAGVLPALLEGIVPAAAKASRGSAGTLSRRLREAPAPARKRLAEDFVRAEVAAVLGHASVEGVGADDAFKDLGFDSLAAVELRNRLGTAADLRLSASVVFDHPTAAALAAHLLERMEGTDGGGSPLAAEMRQLEQALADLSDEEARAELATRLRALATQLDRNGERRGNGADRLIEASDEELLDFIDAQMGSSRG